MTESHGNYHDGFDEKNMRNGQNHAFLTFFSAVVQITLCREFSHDISQRREREWVVSDSAPSAPHHSQPIHVPIICIANYQFLIDNRSDLLTKFVT